MPHCEIFLVNGKLFIPDLGVTVLGINNDNLVLLLILKYPLKELKWHLRK